MKTPHWVGYLVQRPEAHLVHHEAGLHAYNYSNLAIWDILFGTFRNPHHWDAACGLGAENEQRVLEMLRGVDVTKQPLDKPEPRKVPAPNILQPEMRALPHLAR